MIPQCVKVLSEIAPGWSPHGASLAMIPSSHTWTPVIPDLDVGEVAKFFLDSSGKGWDFHSYGCHLPTPLRQVPCQPETLRVWLDLPLPDHRAAAQRPLALSASNDESYDKHLEKRLEHAHRTLRTLVMSQRHPPNQHMEQNV